MNEWISVEERLPPLSGAYLIFEEDDDFAVRIDKAYFAKKLSEVWDFRHREWLVGEKNFDRPGWYDMDDECAWELEDVTYWMPMPDPPEKPMEADISSGPNRKIVVDGLSRCTYGPGGAWSRCHDCPYKDYELDCAYMLKSDALKLLKEDGNG